MSAGTLVANFDYDGSKQSLITLNNSSETAANFKPKK